METPPERILKDEYDAEWPAPRLKERYLQARDEGV
jgi:hypothetical protein